MKLLLELNERELNTMINLLEIAKTKNMSVDRLDHLTSLQDKLKNCVNVLRIDRDSTNTVVIRDDSYYLKASGKVY